jgi:hypothetical protein
VYKITVIVIKAFVEVATAAMTNVQSNQALFCLANPGKQVKRHVAKSQLRLFSKSSDRV